MARGKHQADQADKERIIAAPGRPRRRKEGQVPAGNSPTATGPSGEATPRATSEQRPRAECRLIWAAVAEITVCEGWNPRRCDEMSPEFGELVESVRNSGVIVPVHVRRVDGAMELLAGERRVKAAKAAGRAIIPAIDHGELGDEEGFEITFVENYQRRDLTALEEARAAALLLQHYRGDAAAAAVRLGRSVTWLRQRASIDGNLTAWWKQASSASAPRQWGSLDLSDWTAAHFALIARLPKDEQERLVEEMPAYFDSVAVGQLAKWLAEQLQLLRGAPWPLEDELLAPEAGACATCTSRSGAQPMLWEEMIDPAAINRADRCLKLACWRQKTAAHLQRRRTELQAKYAGLVDITTEDFYPASLTRMRGQAPGNVLTRNAYELASRTAKGAVPALVVHGKREGSLRWVRLAPARREGGGAKVRGAKMSLVDRQLRLQARRWAQVGVELIAQMGKAGEGALGRRGIDYHQELRTLAALAAVFGTALRRSTVDDGDEKCWEEVAALAGEVGERDLPNRLWEQVRGTLQERLRSSAARQSRLWLHDLSRGNEIAAAEAQHIGELLGTDVKALLAEISRRKGFTEPKSWAAVGPKKKAAIRRGPGAAAGRRKAEGR